jgi:hypothetical protein
MKHYNIVLESNAVLNTNIASAPMQLLNIYGYALQVIVTGTPNGTFKLQASCDPFNNQSLVTNWTDVANSPYTMTAAGTYMWNVTDVMYNYMRLVYTDASGGTSTATLVLATLNTKGV